MKDTDHRTERRREHHTVRDLDLLHGRFDRPFHGSGVCLDQHGVADFGDDVLGRLAVGLVTTAGVTLQPGAGNVELALDIELVEDVVV